MQHIGNVFVYDSGVKFDVDAHDPDTHAPRKIPVGIVSPKQKKAGRHRFGYRVTRRSALYEIDAASASGTRARMEREVYAEMVAPENSEDAIIDAIDELRAQERGLKATLPSSLQRRRYTRADHDEQLGSILVQFADRPKPRHVDVAERSEARQMSREYKRNLR